MTYIGWYVIQSVHLYIFINNNAQIYRYCLAISTQNFGPRGPQYTRNFVSWFAAYDYVLNVELINFV